MDDLVFLLACIISILVGIHLGFNLSKIAKASKELPVSDEDAGATKRGIYVEEHQGKLFAYELKTHTFLCSFITYQELHDNLVRIDPKVSWIFYEGTRMTIETFMEKHNGSN